MSVTNTVLGVDVTVCEEESKEKMCFSQCQQESSLGGSWSCVFANGDNWIK